MNRSPGGRGGLFHPPLKESLQFFSVLVACEVSSLLHLSVEGDGARVLKAVLVDDFVAHFVQAVVVVGLVDCHSSFSFLFWCFALAHQRRTFTDGHRGGAGEPSGSLCKVGEECGAFALQSELDRSTVGGGLSGHGGEGLNEGDVLGAGHHVGDTAGGGVDVSGGKVSGKIGSDVGALADGGAGGLDLVALVVSATVVGQVVSLVVFAREGVAHPLLGVLSVVGVLADKVRRKSKFGHGVCSFPWWLGSCPCLDCTTIIHPNAEFVNHQNAQTYALF